MLLQKLAMPLRPHRPPLFCPLSPEAYLLTGTFFIYHFMDSLSKHRWQASPEESSNYFPAETQRFFFVSSHWGNAEKSSDDI
jgi:hypothetical protein